MNDITDLQQQWERLRAAEQAWLDKPDWGTADAYVRAFRAIKIRSVGALLAENARLVAALESIANDHDSLDFSYESLYEGLKSFAREVLKGQGV